jgi:hypothetical protein
MAHDLKPFRDYSEHDVVNLFAFTGDQTLIKKGLFVRVTGEGFVPSAGTTPVELLGNIGASFPNSQSQRFGVKSKIIAAPSGDSTVLGMTLLDVRELDENGEKLIFNPRKAAEMNVVLSGQAVPVLTKGIVLYSGTTATAGHVAYIGATAGELLSAASLPAGGAVKVGKWLGNSSQGVALLKIEL